MKVTTENYRNILLQFPMARVLIAVDGKSFSYVDINTLAEEYFDVTFDEIVGKRTSDVFEKTLQDHLEQSYNACLKTGKPVSINIAPRFTVGVKVQSFLVNPVKGDDGDIEFIDMIARPDTDDGQQVERERDDAILLLTSLFDATGVGIMVTDDAGRIVRINDTFLQDYGWLNDELVGCEFTKVIPPEEHEMSRKLHAAFIERGRQGSREIQVLKKDGNLADIWLTTVLLELSHRRRFMVATVRDITERKTMIKRLRGAKEAADMANRAKSAFLANMSHELRTPLNAVIGFSEIMKDELFGPVGNKKYVEYLTDVHFSARHLLDIINDVLDMSKIEAGKVELVETEIDLREVFSSVQIIMGDRVKSVGINLIFEVEDKLPHIRADQRLLRQIIINLVSNSSKFSPEGSDITVKAKLVDGKYLRISVQDTGCGIPANKIQVVLEPFGQVTNASHHNRGQGTGLGLPLAKAMMELHGGHLTLETREGYGTNVYLDFPLDRVT